MMTDPGNIDHASRKRGIEQPCRDKAAGAPGKTVSSRSAPRGSRVGLARRSMPAHVSTNGILKLGIGASGINMTYSAGYGYSW
ncbi:hypothetical protein [Burkholderia ubonensis]|uniref:hypothetical protein n=1 Tax=Burkholderia ubonensis TaxID=101571 RepID=UPI000A3EC3BA|nr:hypothetical protein [Burkholderia ubonensis]